MNSTQGNAFDWKILMICAVLASVVVGFVGGYFVGGAQQKVQVSLVDDYGRTVELSGIPQRIVSAAPTPTEILFAVGAGGQVVGVDDYSDYPVAVKNLTKVGSYTLNLEVILSLHPDLVVCSDLVPKSQLDLIETQGIPYFIFATRTMDDVYKDLNLAGVLTGHSIEAQTLVAGLRARVNAVTEKTLDPSVEKPRTYIEYYPLWTYGPGSFGDDIIRLAGGTNIAANASNEYPQLTPEFVIEKNPQVIVYTVGPMTTTNAAEIEARSGWGEISAVSNGKIYSIDDNLLSRYGPRIVDGLEQLAEILHPDLFG